MLQRELIPNRLDPQRFPGWKQGGAGMPAFGEMSNGAKEAEPPGVVQSNQPGQE